MFYEKVENIFLARQRIGEGTPFNVNEIKSWMEEMKFEFFSGKNIVNKNGLFFGKYFRKLFGINILNKVIG